MKRAHIEMIKRRRCMDMLAAWWFVSTDWVQTVGDPEMMIEEIESAYLSELARKRRCAL